MKRHLDCSYAFLCFPINGVPRSGLEDVSHIFVLLRRRRTELVLTFSSLILRGLEAPPLVLLPEGLPSLGGSSSCSRLETTTHSTPRNPRFQVHD